MHESLDVIGPDEEIEVLFRKFDGWKRISSSTMTFEQFVVIHQRPLSNAWAYESNRKGTTLITF